MKILAGILAGITLTILWHTVGWPWIGWLFTRIPPPTPDDWAPKYRTWLNGVAQ